MHVDIRKNIIENFKDSNEEEIKESIEESIINNEEITLPGLGVFFELVWKHSNADLQNQILNIIKQQLK